MPEHPRTHNSVLQVDQFLKVNMPPSDTHRTSTPSISVLSHLKVHIKEQIDEKTGQVMIVKKKKGKGRARGSTTNSQMDGQSLLGSISNCNIDIKNIFQQGIRQKVIQSKKKKRTTVVNETLQEQQKMFKMKEKEEKKQKIKEKIDLWDLGI